MTILRNNVQDAGDGVKGVNNNLDVILHGAGLFLFIRSSITV